MFKFLANILVLIIRKSVPVLKFVDSKSLLAVQLSFKFYDEWNLGNLLIDQNILASRLTVLGQKGPNLTKKNEYSMQSDRQTETGRSEGGPFFYFFFFVWMGNGVKVFKYCLWNQICCFVCVCLINLSFLSSGHSFRPREWKS